MILQMPHSFRWGDRAWVVRSKTLAKSVNGRCQRLACYVPMSGGERQIRHFSSAFILMYAVFIIYMTVWLTLLCVLFDFYWIYIKICGESVPLRPDRTEKIYKSPEGLTKSVRFSGLFFLSGKCINKGYAKQQKRDEQMAKRSVHYARGPPKWIRTDSLSWIKTEKVNHIWFTLKPRPNAPCVGQMLRIAHGREERPKTAVWRVCGAVGRREPYNLTLESKTYYTQKDDSMR